MAIGPWQTLFEVGSAAGWSDSELLTRSADRDGPSSDLAFAILVERHGPMVLRVCRKALGNRQDARDAFQATFLVLARKAASIRNRDSVASFLHGVALRVSAASRASEARRRRHERAGAGVENLPRPDAELDRILHEEIGRLPRHYREAVILCYLEGKTGAEAAAILKCPVGTIKSRLSWARNRLRDRLVKRGMVPSVAASAFVAAQAGEAAVPLPLGWAEGAASLAMKFARGVGGEVPAASATMARKVMIAMTWSRAKVAVLALALAVASAATGLTFMTKAGGQVEGKKVGKTSLVFPPIEPKNKLIRAMLDKKVEMEVRTPCTLEAFIKAIKAASQGPDDHGIPIYISPDGLRDVGHTMASEVPAPAKTGRIGVLLVEAIRPLKLSYHLRDGLLVIDSRAAILESRLDDIDRKLNWLIETQNKALPQPGR